MKISPVQCAFCGGKYDLADVVPVTRFADCTTFKTPCCNKLVDDREHTGSPAFYRIDKMKAVMDDMMTGKMYWR